MHARINGLMLLRLAGGCAGFHAYNCPCNAGHEHYVEVWLWIIVQIAEQAHLRSQTIEVCTNVAFHRKPCKPSPTNGEHITQDPVEDSNTNTDAKADANADTYADIVVHTDADTNADTNTDTYKKNNSRIWSDLNKAYKQRTNEEQCISISV